MDQIFYNQDVGAVIGVSLSMMNSSKHELETAMKKKHATHGVTNDLQMYQPVTEFDDIYKKYENLFL